MQLYITLNSCMILLSTKSHSVIQGNRCIHLLHKNIINFAAVCMQLYRITVLLSKAVPMSKGGRYESRASPDSRGCLWWAHWHCGHFSSASVFRYNLLYQRCSTRIIIILISDSLGPSEVTIPRGLVDRTHIIIFHSTNFFMSVSLFSL